MRIVHLTDPHLSSLANVPLSRLSGKRWLGYQSWYRRRRHQYLPSALVELTRAARDCAPDVFVVSGDLVQIGLPEEFPEALDWLAGLGPPGRVLLTPGNHDCYRPDSWAAFQQTFAAYLPEAESETSQQGFPRMLAVDGVRVIGLSSAQPAPWFAATGRVGDGQLARLRRTLADTARPRVLAVHHPPLPGMAPARKALRDASKLREVIADAGCEVVLHGHLHRNTTREFGRTRIFCTASAASVRTDQPASFRLFDINPGNTGWRIDMTLTASLGGVVRELERCAWQVDVDDHSARDRA